MGDLPETRLSEWRRRVGSGHCIGWPNQISLTSMAPQRAKLRSNYGHADILIEADGPLGATWLADYFETEVASGVRFAAGETIQIGWTILMLEDTENGDLTILEPDFKTIPIRWVPGANECLRILALQRAVCEAMGVEPDFPSLRQPISVPGQGCPAMVDFTMGRVEVATGHSGWVFDGPAVAMMSLYEASIQNPAIMAFLALPADAMVVCRLGSCEVSCGGRTLSSSNNDILSHLLRGRGPDR